MAEKCYPFLASQFRKNSQIIPDALIAILLLTLFDQLKLSVTLTEPYNLTTR